MIGCKISTLGKAFFFVSRYTHGLALGQAVLDDLTGLWWDPVGEEHLELHHQVASLGRALGHRKTFAPQPPHSAGLDHVAAGQRHHSVVKSWDVNGAATESLGTEKERKG